MQKLLKIINTYRVDFIGTLICSLIMFSLIFAKNSTTNVFWLLSYIYLPLIMGMVSYNKRKRMIFSSMIIASGMSILSISIFAIVTAGFIESTIFGYSYLNYLLVIIIIGIIISFAMTFIALIGEHLRRAFN